MIDMLRGGWGLFSTKGLILGIIFHNQTFASGWGSLSIVCPQFLLYMGQMSVYIGQVLFITSSSFKYAEPACGEKMTINPYYYVGSLTVNQYFDFND
jgi:hypothetical protein